MNVAFAKTVFSVVCIFKVLRMEIKKKIIIIHYINKYFKNLIKTSRLMTCHSHESVQKVRLQTKGDMKNLV